MRYVAALPYVNTTFGERYKHDQSLEFLQTEFRNYTSTCDSYYKEQSLERNTTIGNPRVVHLEEYNQSPTIDRPLRRPVGRGAQAHRVFLHFVTPIIFLAFRFFAVISPSIPNWTFDSVPVLFKHVCKFGVKDSADASRLTVGALCGSPAVRPVLLENVVG